MEISELCSECKILGDRNVQLHSRIEIYIEIASEYSIHGRLIVIVRVLILLCVPMLGNIGKTACHLDLHLEKVSIDCIESDVRVHCYRVTEHLMSKVNPCQSDTCSSIVKILLPRILLLRRKFETKVHSGWISAAELLEMGVLIKICAPERIRLDGQRELSACIILCGRLLSHNSAR